jgi:hypothetical protein
VAGAASRAGGQWQTGSTRHARTRNGPRCLVCKGALQPSSN